ncbi:MAG: hypothetical protein JW852_11940 [Spirochaetales bacterium]|nr:hypothetical protein [Spirochaetales bacterium]
MMKTGRDSGSVTLQMLVVLIGLSILSFGAATVIQIGIAGVRRAESYDSTMRSLREAAEAAVSCIVNDPSPGSQSRIDPLSREIADLSAEMGLPILVEDLSAKIGINWVRKEVLNGLGLFSDAASPADFQQHREEIGFRLDMAESYGDFIDGDDLQSYFTPYSYWNINVSDEFTLEALFALRTGDEFKAREFRSRIQGLRTDQRILSREDLPEFLGDEYPALYAVLIAEPPINIHFADEVIIDRLFLHYGGPMNVAQRIKSTRESTELTDEWLTAALGEAENGGVLLQYLGARSWFWSIEVEADGIGLRWILCRMAGRDESNNGMQLKLIQETSRY